MGDNLLIFFSIPAGLEVSLIILSYKYVFVANDLALGSDPKHLKLIATSF